MRQPTPQTIERDHGTDCIAEREEKAVPERDAEMPSPGNVKGERCCGSKERWRRGKTGGFRTIEAATDVEQRQ